MHLCSENSTFFKFFGGKYLLFQQFSYLYKEKINFLSGDILFVLQQSLPEDQLAELRL